MHFSPCVIDNLLDCQVSQSTLQIADFYGCRACPKCRHVVRKSPQTQFTKHRKSMPSLSSIVTCKTSYSSLLVGDWRTADLQPDVAARRGKMYLASQQYRPEDERTWHVAEHRSSPWIDALIDLQSCRTIVCSHCHDFASRIHPPLLA